MRLNKIFWFIFFLLISVATGLVLKRQFVSESDLRSGTLASQDVIHKVKRITIEQGNQKVILAHSDKGEWLIESDGLFPADARKMRAFLTSLSTLKIERRVSAKSDRLGEFGLGGQGVKVRFEESSKTLLDLELGELRPGGGGQYIRFSDEPVCYLVNSGFEVQAQNDFWQYKTLLEIPRKDVRSITWEEGDKLERKAVYAREKAEDKFTLNPKDDVLKEEHFEALLSNISELSFTQKQPRNSENVTLGNVKPLRRVTVSLFDGRQVLLVTRGDAQTSSGLVEMELENSGAPVSLSAATVPMSTSVERMERFSKAYRFFFPTQVAVGDKKSL